MAGSVVSSSTSFRFDDRNIRWFPFGDFRHFVFAMLDVDTDRRVVDLILKFEPNLRIFLHRHLSLTNTLVVQGEHRLYEPNGALKEVRRVGSYTSSPPGEPHREGGGDEGAVVFYSLRADGNDLFDVFDDDMNVASKLTIQDFADALAAQKNA